MVSSDAVMGLPGILMKMLSIHLGIHWSDGLAAFDSLKAPPADSSPRPEDVSGPWVNRSQTVAMILFLLEKPVSTRAGKMSGFKRLWANARRARECEYK